MENIPRAVLDGAQVVARVVEYQVRQLTTSAIESATSATVLPGSPTPVSSLVTPSMASLTTSSTDGTATPSTGATENGGGGGGGGGGGNSSSPLLFFVALGFGVVFTNLWIIVGVKYCFRYNARNRALARLDENGEPIDLQNMPARPHRRRREKKLMTMEEVNEKFPMVKYKTWVLDRKKEGLPTAGGISAPASRANSVRSVEGIVPEHPDNRESTDEPAPTTSPESDHIAQSQPKSTDKNEQKSSDETPNTSPTVTNERNATATNNEAGVTGTETPENPSTKDSLHRTSEDDEEDDDHINPALDPDMMGSSGDTCAICIDTLEDDDDIPG
ncbi:hypothetical protein O1611_g3576 [Lasiodiplodia mahajangana]|uniref:Uncharacterized protein n=1 Tax=Lasiodiplodia mahajangana TaxID=1108764 RepID=A0ACC2JRC9_9PEZI|nr:hypothetical protein O1611_g3576 [Lasiodiplodia mahajangana]